MSSKFSSFSRRGPDNVTEELVEVLSSKKSYEFKALFQVVHEGLKARNAASGGEEMLRLRAYEKLQSLVNHGQVKKTGKEYKGVPAPLSLLAENLKSLRENGPVFVQRPPRPAAKKPVVVEDVSFEPPKVKKPKAAPKAKAAKSLSSPASR